MMCPAPKAARAPPQREADCQDGAQDSPVTETATPCLISGIGHEAAPGPKSGPKPPT